MKRYIFTLAASIFGIIYSLASDCSLLPKECIYMLVDIEKKDSYPVAFELAMDIKDTLSVSLKDEETFLNKILEDATYIPVTWSVSDIYLYDLYGKKIENIECAREFSMTFYDMMKRNQEEISFKLKTGSKVTITYFVVRGIFLRRSNPASSMGLSEEDYPQIKNSCIPVAVTQYSKPPRIYLKTD